MAVGWVLFAYYANQNCDPLAAGDIANVNQILPRFIVTVVDYPGIPELFFAAVVCGSLSSLSYSLNAVAAVVWDDCLKSCFPNLSELKKASLLKIIATFFGVVCLGAAYMFLYVGGTLIGPIYCSVNLWSCARTHYGIYISGMLDTILKLDWCTGWWSHSSGYYNVDDDWLS